MKSKEEIAEWLEKQPWLERFKNNIFHSDYENWGIDVRQSTDDMEYRMRGKLVL